ncbi:uncharacterized protein DUF4037 [Sediminihabitans luteus]|uniref:Uncharacterized protein DUF4037 n=1 Tax=Sediminihabitans luteus TaxID=1138585 RepID=A0A2M9CQS4_9CELL|nr:DUF4037 domain-containing protein [Sediminihabitans luteus]PJJ74273.1 uncharacterized protein DUF4037 [Sediminihabitans luteus]GII99126.1 hypothetical protein Slu03_15040 [Sediminihabitans luteus]
MSGTSRARGYWEQVVRPLVVDRWPGLGYAAGRLGSGSDVLGLDDGTSTDHDWGNRLTLLVDADRVADVDAWLEDVLPPAFDGLPTRFATTWSPQVRHGVDVASVAGFVHSRLGVDATAPLEPSAWLGLTGQSVLEVVAGDVFEDVAGELTAVRERLAWMPHDVWLAVLAGEWAAIAQELPFVGRAGERGDDLGSRVVAARLVERTVRLGFWLDRRWPPYAKWLGTLHARLPRASVTAAPLGRALAADDWRTREAAIVEALETLHDLQRDTGLPAAASAVVPFHTRGFAGVGDVPELLRDAVDDAGVRAWSAGTASVEQWATSVPVLMDPTARSRVAAAALGPEPRRGPDA